MSVEEIFGLILREYRTTKGLSQEELAHRSNLDRTFISLLERGKRRPTINTIFNIADTLEINAYEIVRRVEIIYKDNSGLR